MHVRASHIRGMQVVDDSTQYTVALLDDPLIQPDTGEILGFFVHALVGEGGMQFLQTIDIVQWGTKVHISSADVLAPLEELVRLQERLADARTMLYQPIRVRPGGRRLGRCMDVQFDTKISMVEWLFPKRWFFFRDPIPATEIIEVTSNAIWVKPLLRPIKKEITEEQKTEALPAIDPAVATMQRK